LISEIFSPDSYQLSFIGLPRAIIATVGILLPIFLYLKNRKNPIYQLYFFVLTPAFIWQFAFAWMMQAKTPEIALFWCGVGRVGTFFIPSFVYAFSVFHTNSLRQFPIVLLCFVFSFVCSLFVYHPYLLSYVHHYSWGYYGILGPGHSIILTFMFLTGVGLYFNLWRDFKTAPSQNQRKLDWFLMIAFGGAYVGAFEFLPGLGYDVKPVGFIAVSFWSLVLLWAILKYRSSDLETLITQTFNYMALTTGVIFLYIAFMALAKWVLAGVIDWPQLFFFEPRSFCHIPHCRIFSNQNSNLCNQTLSPPSVNGPRNLKSVFPNN